MAKKIFLLLLFYDGSDVATNMTSVLGWSRKWLFLLTRNS
jgi:hypothetical protein